MGEGRCGTKHAPPPQPTECGQRPKSRAGYDKSANHPTFRFINSEKRGMRKKEVSTGLVRCSKISRAPLGYRAKGALRGGGFCPLPNLRESGRREAEKAAIENYQPFCFKGTLEKKNSKSSQVRLRSNQRSKSFFRLIGYQDGINNSFEAKLCQIASQRMNKVHSM